MLLAYNRASSRTLRQLLDVTGLADEELQAALLALTAPSHPVLVGPEPPAKLFRPNDVFSINTAFAAPSDGSKLVHVHSTALASSAGDQRPTSMAAHGVFVDLVDASIMRAVKVMERDLDEIQRYVLDRCAPRVAVSPDFVAERVRRLCGDGLLRTTDHGYAVCLLTDAEPALPPLSRVVSVSDAPATVAAEPEPGLLRVMSVQQDVAFTMSVDQQRTPSSTGAGGPDFISSDSALRQLWGAISALAQTLQVSPSLALLVLSDRRARWDPR